MASVGSSHSALTSGEDHEEASLLGCPPIGLLDEEEFRTMPPRNQARDRALYPRPKTPRLTDRSVKRPRVGPIRDPTLFEIEKPEEAGKLANTPTVERPFSLPGILLGLQPSRQMVGRVVSRLLKGEH